MNHISKQFISKLKTHPLPAYKICQAVGVDHNYLSKCINGIIPIKANDERLIKIGSFLNLQPNEIFVCNKKGGVA